MQRLTIINPIDEPGARHKRALYACSCGAQKVVVIAKVEGGLTRSCGCYRREALAERQRKHGRYYEPEFSCWKNMIARCSGRGHGAPWYRGVYICERWLRSYEAFRQDVGPRPNSAYTLDRKDPAGDYEPGNVRWATRTQQSRNSKNHCTNKTGARGVSWSKAKGKWRAAIYVNNRQVHVGYFADIEAAALARKAAEEKLWTTR